MIISISYRSKTLYGFTESIINENKNLHHMLLGLPTELFPQWAYKQSENSSHLRCNAVSLCYFPTLQRTVVHLKLW